MWKWCELERARFDENAYIMISSPTFSQGTQVTTSRPTTTTSRSVVGSEPPREQQPSDVSRAGVTTPVRVWRNASAPANEGDLITKATRRDVESGRSHPTVVSRARASSPLHVSTTYKDDADLTVAVGGHTTSNRPTVFSDGETTLPAIDGTPKKDGSNIGPDVEHASSERPSVASPAGTSVRVRDYPTTEDNSDSTVTVEGHVGVGKPTVVEHARSERPSVSSSTGISVRARDYPATLTEDNLASTVAVNGNAGVGKPTVFPDAGVSLPLQNTPSTRTDKTVMVPIGELKNDTEPNVLSRTGAPVSIDHREASNKSEVDLPVAVNEHVSSDPPTVSSDRAVSFLSHGRTTTKTDPDVTVYRH